MTLPEISREFDILYNNIMSNQAPGLDEYEKSVLLTKSQDEILKNYFNPSSNTLKEGFDELYFVSISKAGYMIDEWRSE